jgi:hypothetical protein
MLSRGVHSIGSSSRCWVVAACVVLVRRPINWRAVFTANRWVIFYFLYLGFSVLWSDYSTVAFKRWVKDVGSALMVLVILTEANPLQALKTTFLRCAYVLVPLSVLFIKYVPELGRGYDPWSYEPVNIGVTTNKNMLGMTLFICGLSLLWALLEKWEARLAGPKWKRFDRRLSPGPHGSVSSPADPQRHGRRLHRPWERHSRRDEDPRHP